MGLDPVLESAMRNAAVADDADVAAILLSVANGIDAVLTRCRWDAEALFASVTVLGRLPPESAPARLVLGAFFAQQLWRDRYSDCARRLLVHSEASCQITLSSRASSSPVLGTWRWLEPRPVQWVLHLVHNLDCMECSSFSRLQLRCLA